MNNNSESKTMAIISMIFGILSVVCCWMYHIGISCSVAAIILSAKFKKRNGRAIGMSKAGMALGIIGLVLVVVWFVLVVGFVAIGAMRSQMGY